MPITHQQFLDTLQDSYRQIHETKGEAYASEFLNDLFSAHVRRPTPDPRCRPVQDVVEAASKAMANNTADTWSGAAAYAAWASMCSDLRALAINQVSNGGHLGAVRGPIHVVYPMIADLPRKLVAVSWNLLADAAPVILRRATDPIRVQPLIAFNVSAWNVPTGEMFELHGAWHDPASLPSRGQCTNRFDDWHNPSGAILRTGDLVAALADSLAGVTLRDAPKANPRAELFNVLFQGEWNATKAALGPK